MCVCEHTNVLSMVLTYHCMFVWFSAVVSSVRGYVVLPPTNDEEEKAMLHRMMRVDHAGEYGANRIYAGQMAVLGHTQISPLIQVSVHKPKLWNITQRLPFPYITFGRIVILVCLERTAFSEVWCNMDLGIQCDVECDDILITVKGNVGSREAAPE